MLGTIRITIFMRIDGGTLFISRVLHIVAFEICPIHRSEWFVANSGGVTPMRVQIARRFSITSNRCYRGANHTFGRVSHVALEWGHVHLIGTTNGVVNPKPGADALAIRTGREIRNIERLKCSCRAISNN
jgi:hypothetical protein